MTDEEIRQHETIKELLKQVVDFNPNIPVWQKQLVKQRIDVSAQQADWILEIFKQNGWLR